MWEKVLRFFGVGKRKKEGMLRVRFKYHFRNHAGIIWGVGDTVEQARKNAIDQLEKKYVVDGLGLTVYGLWVDEIRVNSVINWRVK